MSFFLLFLQADNCLCYDSLVGVSPTGSCDSVACHFLLFLQADNCLCYDSLVGVSPFGSCDSVTCHSFFYSYRLITACVMIRLLVYLLQEVVIV
jgi:hypothetical protein